MLMTITYKDSLSNLKQKYNNAKRSIPAHPTFANDTHRDLHL